MILPLLTGFSLTSSTYTQILLSAQVVSNFNYLIKVDTQSDCIINRINLYVVFVDNQALTSNNYLFQGGQSLMVSSSADVNSVSYTATIDNYTSTVFLLGTRGIAGFTILFDTTWGWSLLNQSSNGTATITIDKYQLQYVYFSFLQIGQYSTTTSEPPIGPTV